MTIHMEKVLYNGIKFLFMLYRFHFNFYKPIQVYSDSKGVSRHLYGMMSNAISFKTFIKRHRFLSKLGVLIILKLLTFEYHIVQ